MNKAQIIKSYREFPWSEVKLKVHHYLPRLVFIVLVILLAQTFAELTWKLFSDEQDKAIISTKSQYRPVQAQATSESLKEVASYHLFGDAQKPVVAPQQIIDAPETRLRLDLKGVFATTDSSNALAIISSSKNKDKTYHIGDKITGGALLHAVYADRVILKRNGQLETLRLPKTKLDSKAVTRSQPQTRNLQPVQEMGNNQESEVLAKSQAQYLKDMRDTLMKEPEKIWQQVRINPVMKNGKVEGYTLAHNDQGLMAAMNLRKTDIITGVNGQSLRDPATLYGLMDTLAGQQSIELTVNRNGQEQVIQLSF